MIQRTNLEEAWYHLQGREATNKNGHLQDLHLAVVIFIMLLHDMKQKMIDYLNV